MPGHECSWLIFRGDMVSQTTGTRRRRMPAGPRHPMEMSPRQFLRYLKTFPGLDEAFRREVLKHPEALVAVVKKLREMAVDASIPQRRRRAAEQLLKQH